MKEFNGIEIAEYKLLVENIFFSAFFAIGIGLAIFLLVVMKNNYSEDKTKNNFYELEERAKTDEVAKKRLEKLRKKDRKKRKNRRVDVIFNCVLLALCVGIAVCALLVGVIPGWTDYAKKDYVVYEGEIEVNRGAIGAYRGGKYSYIKLEDGTVIDGRAGLSYEDKYGTVVYSRRTKIALGGIAERE